MGLRDRMARQGRRRSRSGKNHTRRRAISWGNSSFHSQQAAEKALKALLVRYQINFPKSHDIAALLLLAEPRAPGIAAALDAARVLTMYAVETRYPDSDPVSKADASRHVELADGVVTYVRRQLNAYLAAGRPRG